MAKKTVADSAGIETEVPMEEWIPIGMVGPASDDGTNEPIYLQRHRVRSGEQTITITVPRKPVAAGVDPYHLLELADHEDDTNVEWVTVASESDVE